MYRALFISVILVIPLLSYSQSKHDIPVYPGATLKTSLDPGEEAVCCTFSTADPFANVLKFYEMQLNTKALDIAALRTRCPAMKVQFDQMQSHMPSGFQYRGFIVGEVNYGTESQPLIFEVYCSNGRTSFSIPDEELGLSGARTAYEFRKATGTLCELDKEYSNWQSQHPEAKQSQFDFPMYPGSLVGGIEVNGDWVEDPTSNASLGSKCSNVGLIVIDTLLYDKVIAFYKEELKDHFKITEPNDPDIHSFAMEDKQFSIETIVLGEDAIKQKLHGKPGDINRTIEVGLDALIPGIPYFDADQKTLVRGQATRCIVIDFKTEVLDGTCVPFPKQ